MYRAAISSASKARILTNSAAQKGCTAMTGQIIGVCKDGASGPKNIDFKDRVKTVCATVVKPAANATMDVAGYGTTSATSRTRAITTEGCKSVAPGTNVMGLRHGIPMAIDTVVTNSMSLARMMSTSSMSGKEIAHNLPDLPFVDAFLMKAKKNTELLNNRKIWSRRSSILLEFVGSTVRIYNGKTFVRCKITEGKVDHKFGEFALTRKRRPRITASEKKKDKRGK